MKILFLSNAKSNQTDKRSVWADVNGFLSAMSSFPIDVLCFLASECSLGSFRNEGKIEVTNLNVKLPGILDDLNLPYFPMLLANWHKFRAKSLSLVHHHWFTHRGTSSFDTLAVANLLDGIPLVIGGAEVPHVFDYDDFKLYSRRIEASSRVEYRLFRALGAFFSPINEHWFLDTLDKCSALVAVNSAAKRFYSGYVSPKRLHIIPHGVWCDDYRIGPIDNRHQVLMIGNLIKRKGFGVAIRAMKEIRRDIPGATLEIIGDGPEKGNLLRLIREENLESSVTILGRIERKHLLSKLSRCSVFCHTSYSEGYSLPIVEAMGSGRPVVCTDIAGSSDMVVNGINGYVTPAGDASMIADRLLRIMTDRELARRMSSNSRNRAQSYDWGNVAKEYLSVYQSLE